MKKDIKIFYTDKWEDYELLDTGGREKLEKVGPYFFVRPCEDAIWNKTLSKKEWENIDGQFFPSIGGSKAGWKMKDEAKERFIVSFDKLRFYTTPTPFRHFGFFPEQAVHWDFIQNKIKGKKAPKFLNLFGYTGVASLFALRAGADVTHLDASKGAIEWAKENQKIAGLDKMPIRFILDDTMKFLEREIKRGNKYDAIIMDPPKFGRGPKGEIWKIEEKLPKLLDLVKRVLSKDPLFVILNSYSTESSSVSLGYALENIMQDFKGEVSCGELCLKEKNKDRLIAMSNTAIWEKNK